MATEKQIEANRRNSQLSTGPRTDAGKSITRMNALKSGLHAESHVIRTEDPEALTQLTAEYYSEFHPVTPRQRDLLDTVIHNQWLIRRLRLTEADLYARHFEDRDHDFEEKYHFQVAQRDHPLSDSFSSLEKRLSRLQSRLNSLERSTRLALKELSGAGASACQPAEGRQQSTDTPEIGFVPSDVGQASRPARDLQVAPDGHARTASPNPDPTPQIGFVPSTAPALPAPHPLPPDVALSPTLGHIPHLQP
jgi:hypothetical protein